MQTPELEHVQHNSKLDVLLTKLNLDDKTLKVVMNKMTEMMNRGLSNDPKETAKSSLKMLPSFVCSVPDGSETGDHLALDLGGTNFRVLVIKLEQDRHAVQESKIYTVPHAITIGDGEKLFDHIAECLSDFVKERKLEGKKLPLGFTFSFPCLQEGLTAARLITWTKGYRASGVEGKDVAKLLHQAIKRKTGSDIDVVAILNDTVGTLMALAHEDPECQIGVILGTGTNACYMEKAERSPKLQEYLKEAGFDRMIINMEWGAFGDLGELNELRTEFDTIVDKSSVNPGRQTFEKMISGMYMGELTRLILCKLTRDGLVFDGKSWAESQTPNRFYAHYVSEIVKSTAAAACGERSFYQTREVLRDFGATDPTPVDCANVAYVCLSVVRRSAELCAAGIAAILNRLQKPKVTVGIDGSVYRFTQPHFHDMLRDRIKALIDVPCEFQLKLSTDGSGRGAALVAAVAARLIAQGKVSPKPMTEFQDIKPCVLS